MRISLGRTTYAVRGHAVAYSGHGSTPIATRVSCWIKDWRTGATYGPAVTGFTPLHVAVAAGTITAPPSSALMMCSDAYAMFNDATPPVHYRTWGC